jgi:uncharacterized protein (DUF1684 family)
MMQQALELFYERERIDAFRSLLDGGPLLLDTETTGLGTPGIGRYLDVPGDCAGSG